MRRRSIVRLSISFGSDRSLWIAFSTEPALRMAVHRPALIAGRVNRERRFNLTIMLLRVVGQFEFTAR